MSKKAGPMLVIHDNSYYRRSLSLDDASSTEESPEESRLFLETTNDIIPYIGQRFATHDAVYEFYSEFAKRDDTVQREKDLLGAALFVTVLATLLSKHQLKVNLKEIENF